MMKGEWVILLWALLGSVFLVKTKPVSGLVRRVRRQPPAVQATVALCLLVAVITGGTKPGGTNEQSSASQPVASAPENSSLIIQQSSLPSWWPHDATDTDGDGIPDLWEKWTHGNRYVEDSAIDRDEDGLTDLEEFQSQTDPRTADTDGDGFDDAFEVANGMDPLVQADFTPVEPDENENGIIDLWEDAPYFGSFTDSDEDGFDDIYETYYLEPASEGNYDVVVDVYTTRSTALTWTTTNATQGFVLQATADTSVRLRLPFGEDTQIRLVCSPTGGVEAAESLLAPQSMQMQATSTNAIPELWKARIHVDYAPRHVPDGPFLDDGNGRFVEIVNPSAAIIAALLPDPAASAAACGVLVESHSCKVDGLVSSACRVHSGPVAFVCDKTKPEHTLGYTWSSDPSGVTGDMMTNLVSASNFQTGTYAVKCTVECKRNWWTNSRTTYSIASLNVYDCSSPPTVLSVYDNEWHVPTNSPAGCEIPERVYIGFDHAKVKTRNLSRIMTGNADEDITEHCLGVVWEDEGEIDLFSLLGSNYLPYKDDLQFTTTALDLSADGHLVYAEEKPKAYLPDVCWVKVAYEPSSVTLDYLWVVVNGPATQAGFNAWLANNSNISWTSTLPQPYSAITIGSGLPQDPEPGAPRLWGDPHAIDSYLHHDAKFEMRSVPIGDEGHGHQATYDLNGILITNAIAAGTTDIYAPYYSNGLIRPRTTHREEDVKPFIASLRLDGNPVNPNSLDIPQNLNRPCIYKGQSVEQYISKRPVLPTGTQPGVP